MNEFIQLKKDNIFRVGIKDANGKSTGECLEFDLEDIELPLRLNQCKINHENNLNWIKNQEIIISKREDAPSKGIYTRNQEAILHARKEFFKKEEACLDLFLGKGSTRKLLNGRNPFYGMFDEFSEILEPIMDKLNVKADDITSKIKEKYSPRKEDNILE